ncbi:uncharacterized protein LOC112510079 [Cynara cardunculus var. scolymus]|uniref:Sterile alpha motif/pointed domain-containing protein n=1 Tax=Cynara cardunculus var. scolymus TaxID=59895 RepID=A0A103YBI7_CYNCS|nr:uncharacterized protein LOC112510079 [Cynara cardunculus var. scolymus]KVI06051.1 Sterile alpha motif/pointed domain-containing protein [Cynara cardunculus var. scolymus]
MHQAIDWFSWLSKAGLEPSLIYEYGMALSRNELEEGDIAYFNHEFLQSMGISIAKHRLEILKLARKQKGSSGSHPISKLMIAIKKTKRTLANYIHTWVRRDDSALVLVRRSNGSGWRGAMLRTNNRRMVTFKQANPTLLLTNGYHPMVKSTSAKVNSISSSSLVYGLQYDQGIKDSFDGDTSDEEDGGYLSGNGVQEIQWDTLFQNLKPT